MADEKLELLLNAALEATPQEREKSETLGVGYDMEEKTWEVIVKYHGDLLFLEKQSIIVEPLLAGYAVLTVPEDAMSLLADAEQIEYVEKPKRLYFQALEGKRASCILPVTIRPPYLSGKGVIIGIADSGIDYRHPDFRREDGTTRIHAIWDQSLSPDPEKGWKAPEGFRMGVEFSERQINAALAASQGEGEGQGGSGERGDGEGRGDSGGQRSGGEQSVPVRDVSGHGTAVAGIAAGNGRGIRTGDVLAEGADTGIAPESELLIVKLGSAREESFPRTTELMRAVTYLVKKALSMGRPIAVNISFGNTYGSHDGASLLERFLDNVSEVGRSVICVGSGNEGAAMGHVSGNALQETEIELAVGSYERTLSVQLWKNYADIFQVTLVAPGGSRLIFSTDDAGVERMRRITLEETELLLYIGEPTPYSASQEIYLDFLPAYSYVAAGIWTFILTPVSLVTGNYGMYLPAQSALSQNTGFYRPSPDATLTIPSTASRVITVGAYDTAYDAYADFSGRGYLLAENERDRIGIMQSKPDLAAPGVEIVTAMSEGGYGSVSGTSFATPFVTGAAALLMEWGIIQGNDPYLYGQKVKAYLQRGARELPGLTEFPNPLVGYGALCVEKSLPGFK